MKKKVRVRKLSVWLLIFSMSFAFLIPGNTALAKQKNKNKKVTVTRLFFATAAQDGAGTKT